MNDACSARQLVAFCLVAISAPAITFLSGQPWYAALSAAAGCALLLLGLTVLWRQLGKKSVGQWILQIWGAWAGKALLLLEIAFAVLLLNGFAAGVAGAFPDIQTKPFTSLVLILVCAWTCRRGRDACVRACGVLFLLLSALYLCVLLFALPDAHPERLMTAQKEINFAALGVLLLPVYGLFFADGLSEGSVPGGWFLLLALFPAVAAALCSAVPGSRGSFYQMAKSVEVLSIAQRIEPLVSVALIIGWFGAICLLGLAAGQICAELGGDPKIFAPVACLCAIPGALVKIPFSGTFFLICAVFLTALIPSVTLLAAKLRLRQKE